MRWMGRWAADLVMLLVVLIWGLNNVVVKAALADWVSPGAFNAIRFTVAALLLCGLTLAVEGSLRLPRSLWPRVALLGLIGNGLCQMLYINGLALTPASHVGVWYGTVPLIVAMMSGLLGLERVTWQIWLGAALSGFGMWMVLAGGAGPVRWGWGEVILSGFVLTWAGYTVFARPLAQQSSPLRVTALAMLVGAAFLFPAGLPDLMAQDFGAISANSWLGLLYGAVLTNAAGYSLYVWAARRIGSARVALFNNLTPVLTALGAWLFLGELFRLSQWFGMALVMAGVLAARWHDLRQALTHQQSAFSSRI